MISYDKRFVYIWFFCPLDFKNKRWFRKSNILFTFMFSMIGPFTHVCISYGLTLENGKMYNTAITLGTDGVENKMRDVAQIAGYCCYKIPATKEQQIHMITLAEQIANVEGCYLSKTKLYALNRIIPCLGDESLTNEYQPDWMCSELTMFLLDKTGVIKANKNPKKYTPTDMYVEFREKKSGEDLGGCEYSLRKFKD